MFTQRLSRSHFMIIVSPLSNEDAAPHGLVLPKHTCLRVLDCLGPKTHSVLDTGSGGAGILCSMCHHCATNTHAYVYSIAWGLRHILT